MSKENPKTFRVHRIEQVKSGDDILALVDLGIDSLFKMVRLRLRGVDVPSAHLAAPSTEAGKVRDMVRQHVLGRECNIQVYSMGKGGWVVTLYVQDADGQIVNLNSLLIREGYIYKSERQ